MTRIGVVAIIAFLILVPAMSLEAALTVEVIADDGTNLTYKITSDSGIWRLVFNYEAEDVEPGDPVMVNRSFHYGNCPQTVEITVPKELQIDGSDDIGTLGRILVEDCRPQFHGAEFSHSYIFDVLPEEDFDVGPNPMLSVGPQSDPPLPVPEFNFFEWQFWGLFLWTILTIYLLWWRLFGPFRRE
ncbi:MAG: hypothetical protein GY906_40520 [bacterium]|nr:hypothetical protein [bacterium]